MTSIFDPSLVFTTYTCEIQFRNYILGGIPKSPDVIEGWLRTKAGITNEEELRQKMVSTLLELGAEIDPTWSYEEMVAASKKLAGVRSTNGFKINKDGLYIEDRQIKAAIKEAVNILFAGDRWGKTRKGPRSFTAERVFIDPQPAISLGKKEPDGVELMMVHAITPQGPRSSLAYHEYVDKPHLAFDVMVAQDAIDHELWPMIWTLCQENGLGAARSQSYGRFDVVKWEVKK